MRDIFWARLYSGYSLLAILVGFSDWRAIVVIQWYPGHMTKTLRMMEDSIKHIDVICEVVDARIPISSRNPDIDSLIKEKPKLIIFNRVDIANEQETNRWVEHFRSSGVAVIKTDSKGGEGVSKFPSAVRELIGTKIENWRAKGQVGRPIRVMIVGIPNVGKSTFINRVLKRKSAKASDRPGVTRGKQWFKVEDGIELLDTPGILWPKLNDLKTGINLAVTGAIKDDILDVETLACTLMEILYDKSCESLAQRYKLTLPVTVDEDAFFGYELLRMAAGNRGFLLKGAEVDTERMSRILLDEYRAGIFGKITLETVPDLKND